MSRAGAQNSEVAHALDTALGALQTLTKRSDAIDAICRVASLIAERFAGGKKVLICGNGGSACDAMHFAEELTGRFRNDRPALPAIACADPGHITCTANDYGFEFVFSRWVEALGHKGDVLVVLSTSGNSPNIVRCVEAAKSRGLTTIAFLGKDGGAVRGRCDHEVIFPGDGSDRIQELHMLCLHIIVQQVEHLLFPEKK